jgi:integrase
VKKKYYKKLPSHKGIYKQINTGRYYAVKRIDGEKYTKTFTNLAEARNWRRHFDGDVEKPVKIESDCATLQEVWKQMQVDHFPSLAYSTKDIWIRRYTLLKDIEHMPMDYITPSAITSWVERQTKYFKSEEYEGSCRGKAKRCNLDNELNLFTTIFNWYKQSEVFEAEAVNMTNPIKTKHKRLGFIRAKPIKNMKITLDHALEFFNCLPILYQDLAKMQYFLASRIGEVAGLQWERIDFKNRKVTIMETACFHPSNKTFSHLNPHPKNREPRYAYMTDEIHSILLRRLQDQTNGFVFHVEGKPLNYCTVQSNYKRAIKKADLPYSGTHILRHGMATLARKVGGGLDAVIAMTGHKDYKLADHYSKLDNEYQREISEKIMGVMRDRQRPDVEVFDNVFELRKL